MKNLRISFILSAVIITFAGGMFFSSCEKENTLEDNTNNREANIEAVENVENYDNLTVADMPQLEVREGVLFFEDKNQFLKVISIIELMTVTDRANWEKKIGFLSQARIFEQIIEAELEHDAPYENLSETEIKNIKIMPPLHSDLYYTYLKSNLINETNQGTDEEFYELSLFNPCVAHIVNTDGIYMIGNSIFQITDISEKILENGDISMIDKLKLATKTNENIKVFYANNNNRVCS